MEFLDVGASHVVRVTQIDRPIVIDQPFIVAEAGMSKSRVKIGGTSRATEKVHSSKKEACM